MGKIIQDIKPRGIASAYVDAPFDEGKEALAKRNYKIISLEENAKLRMQEGADKDVSQNGNWVKEDAIYVPNKGKFLTKVSHILANAKGATDCHRNGNDFYLTDEQVEQALADSVLLSLKSVPTNRFADNDITIYAFGENAKKYGEFLMEARIKEMPIWIADMQEKPFARKVWFHGLGGDLGSGLGCDDGDLHVGFFRVRGVCESAEGTSQKVLGSLPYTQRQIEKYSKIVQDVRAGTLPASKLEKVAGFLSSLKQ